MQDHDARRTAASPRTRLLHSEDRLTWTITEAAHLLGISRATAYEAAHRGELPVRLIGRRASPGRAGRPGRAGPVRRRPACTCACGRRIRVARSVLELTPILCGACAQPFEPQDNEAG